MTKDTRNGDEKNGKKGEATEFIVSPQSPYYLHAPDAHGAIITAIKFNGKNYDIWEKAVRTALKVKNKLGFINRTITKTIDLAPPKGNA